MHVILRVLLHVIELRKFLIGRIDRNLQQGSCRSGRDVFTGDCDCCCMKCCFTLNNGTVEVHDVNSGYVALVNL